MITMLPVALDSQRVISQVLYKTQSWNERYLKCMTCGWFFPLRLQVYFVDNWVCAAWWETGRWARKPLFENPRWEVPLSFEMMRKVVMSPQKKQEAGIERIIWNNFFRLNRILQGWLSRIWTKAMCELWCALQFAYKRLHLCYPYCWLWIPKIQNLKS